jgi:hypothetical protein
VEPGWVSVVVRAQVGDRDAVAELVRGWHDQVWTYVRHMLTREDLADDEADWTPGDRTAALRNQADRRSTGRRTNCAARGRPAHLVSESWICG